MKKIKAFLLIVLVLALCAGVFLFTKKIYDVKPEPVIVEVEKEKIVETEAVVSGQTIESGLNNIGKLCTSEYYFEHVENYEDQLKTKNGYAIPLTSSSFVYSYDGKILAGVNFEEIKVTKDEDLKKITIDVPKAYIISSEVDEDSFKLYDQKNNIFNPVSVDEFAISFADLIKSEEQKAIDNGILDRAQSNANMMISNFLSSSYSLDDYSIEVNTVE